MSALVDRITEVQRQHFPEELAYEARCSCGQRFEYEQDGSFAWAGHVAERVAALFTEETRTLTDGWIQPSRNAAYYAQGLTPPPAVITHERRWVSEWAAVEEQPAPPGFAPICEGCGGVKNRHFHGCSAVKDQP